MGLKGVNIIGGLRSSKRCLGKNVTFSCSEQTRPKYLENYNIIVALCQDLVQGLICF